MWNTAEHHCNRPHFSSDPSIQNRCEQEYIQLVECGISAEQAFNQARFEAQLYTEEKVLKPKHARHLEYLNYNG